MLISGKRNVYGSVVEELKRMIAAGALKEGEKLPSVRALALEKGINPNTVQRAYLQLEEEGFIRIYAKKGAFVAGKKGEEEEEIEAIFRSLKQTGISRERMEKALKAVFEEEDDD